MSTFEPEQPIYNTIAGLNLQGPSAGLIYENLDLSKQGFPTCLGPKQIQNSRR